MHCSLSEVFSKSPYLSELLIPIVPQDRLHLSDQRRGADAGRRSSAVRSGAEHEWAPSWGSPSMCFNISMPRSQIILPLMTERFPNPRAL